MFFFLVFLCIGFFWFLGKLRKRKEDLGSYIAFVGCIEMILGSSFIFVLFSSLVKGGFLVEISEYECYYPSKITGTPICRSS